MVVGVSLTVLSRGILLTHAQKNGEFPHHRQIFFARTEADESFAAPGVEFSSGFNITILESAVANSDYGGSTSSE